MPLPIAPPGPVVVLGAGRIGCAVVAERLLAGGMPVLPAVSVVMVSRTADDARLLRSGRVRIRSGERPELVRSLRPLAAIPASAHAVVADLVRDASLVIVATGEAHQAEIAPAVARGLGGRSDAVDVVVCGEGSDPAGRFRAVVAEQTGQPIRRHTFAGLLVDQIVLPAHRHGTGAASGMLLTSEPPGPAYVEARELRRPLPAMPGLHPVESLEPYTLRRLHVLRAGQAAAAYLGAWRGHSSIGAALSDPDVSAVVRAAVREGQAGLAVRFGSGFAGGEADVTRAVARLSHPLTEETVEQVIGGMTVGGRRGIRPDDRICGPARLAAAAGIPVPALAVVAAAAAAVGDGGLWSSGPHLTARIARTVGLSLDHPFVTAARAAAELLGEGVSPAVALARLATGSHVARDDRPEPTVWTW